MPYPASWTPRASILATIPGVPPSSLPSTVILDREGRIAARVIGATDADGAGDVRRRDHGRGASSDVLR